MIVNERGPWKDSCVGPKVQAPSSSPMVKEVDDVQSLTVPVCSKTSFTGLQDISLRSTPVEGTQHHVLSWRSVRRPLSVCNTFDKAACRGTVPISSPKYDQIRIRSDSGHGTDAFEATPQPLQTNRSDCDMMLTDTRGQLLARQSDGAECETGRCSVATSLERSPVYHDDGGSSSVGTAPRLDFRQHTKNGDSSIVLDVEYFHASSPASSLSQSYIAPFASSLSTTVKPNPGVSTSHNAGRLQWQQERLKVPSPETDAPTQATSAVKGGDSSPEKLPFPSSLLPNVYMTETSGKAAGAHSNAVLYSGALQRPGSCCACRRDNSSAPSSSSLVSGLRPSSKPSMEDLSISLQRGGAGKDPSTTFRGPYTAVKDSALRHTLTFMRYRAFQRWYHGAHEKGWSRPAAAILMVLASALMLFASHNVCSFHAIPREATIYHILVIAALPFVLLLGRNRHFVPRWSVRLSLFFVAISVITVGYATVYDFAHSVRRRSVQLFRFQEQRAFEDADEDGTFPFAREHCSYVSYVIIFFYCAQGFTCLCGFCYSHCLERLAKYYFIKSSWFVSKWRIVRCHPIRLLVPGLGQTDKERYRELVEALHQGMQRSSRQQSGGRKSSREGRARAWTAQGLSSIPAVVTSRRSRCATSSPLRRPHLGSGQDAFSLNLPAPAAGGCGLTSVSEADEDATPAADETALQIEERLRISSGLRIECEATSFSRACLRKCALFLPPCCRRRRKKDKKRDLETSVAVSPFGRCWKRHHASMKQLFWAEPAVGAGHTFRRVRRRRIRKVTFVGEVNALGQPEGFGFWKEDGNDYGERLVGYWSNGLPNGPHKSRELGSGSGFMCIRIGWARYNLTDDVLKFGVANVECSVSGKFYRGYPAVTLLDPPTIEETKDGGGSQLLPTSTTGRATVQMAAPCSTVLLRQSSLSIKQKPDTECDVLPKGSLLPSSIHGTQMPTPEFYPEPTASDDDEYTITYDGTTGRNATVTAGTGKRCDRVLTEPSAIGSETFPAINNFPSHWMPPPDEPASFLFYTKPHAQTDDVTSLRSGSITGVNPAIHHSAFDFRACNADELVSGISPIAADDRENKVTTATPENRHARRRHRTRLSLRFRGLQKYPRRVLQRSQSESVAAASHADVLWPQSQQSDHRRTHDFTGRRAEGAERRYLPTAAALKRFGRGAINVPQHIRAGKTVATEARAAVIRLLRRRDIERFARLEKGRRDIAWALAELSPHTPNFGIQPRNEIVLSVDHERGLYISGWIQKDRVLESPEEPSYFDEFVPHQFAESVQQGKNSLEVPTLQSTQQIQHVKDFSPHPKPSQSTVISFPIDKDTCVINLGGPLTTPSCPGRVAQPLKDTALEFHSEGIPAPSGLESDVRQEQSTTIPQTDILGRRGGFMARMMGNLSPKMKAEWMQSVFEPRENRKKDENEDDRYGDKEDAIVHHPLYRRPTIESGTHQKDFTGLKINVVRRRLIVSGNTCNQLAACPATTYKKQTQEANVRKDVSGCNCACHDAEKQWWGGSLDETGTFPPSQDMYAPDAQAQNLDTWDARYEASRVVDVWGVTSRNLSSCSLDVEVPELEADGWLCRDAAGSPEVLIYIHGYNNSHIESLQILGQMAAFGNYPNHIRLFLFSWPAGNGAFDFFKARKAAEDPKTHKALGHFLQTLRDNGALNVDCAYKPRTGIRQLHIMCHSMGSRLFLKSFRGIADTLFQTVKSEGREPVAVVKSTENQPRPPPSKKKPTGKLQLASVTFLNPEYFLDEFVEEDYPRLRSFCNQITIFADAKDHLSRRPALGKNVFGLWRPMGSFFSSSGSIVKHPLRYVNTVSFFRYNSYSGPRESLGGDGRDEDESTIEWLDVDVIDTTFIDQNVHTIRHSFWNLNREIIEDIREFMVTRKRARQRTGRLDRRDGNVWVYRVAPSFLTSIFDVYL